MEKLYEGISTAASSPQLEQSSRKKYIGSGEDVMLPGDSFCYHSDCVHNCAQSVCQTKVPHFQDVF